LTFPENPDGCGHTVHSGLPGISSPKRGDFEQVLADGLQTGRIDKAVQFELADFNRIILADNFDRYHGRPG
jgi:hypothetical protein